MTNEGVVVHGTAESLAPPLTMGVDRRRDVDTAKSQAKVWGDGSEVSARRSNAEFQARFLLCIFPLSVALARVYCKGMLSSFLSDVQPE